MNVFPKFYYLIFVFVILSGVLLKLSPSEINHEIIISFNNSNPPFKFVNDKGLPDGLLIDIWNLWSTKTGIVVKFISADFNQTVEMIKNGTADVNAGLFYTKERDKYLDFCSPIMDVDYFLFADKSIYKKDFDLKELNAFKIGVPEGYTAEFTKLKYPNAAISIYPDFPSLYSACENKEIKIFVSPKENLEYFLESSGKKNNYLVLYSKPLYSQTYLGAVKKENKDLQSIINSGFEKISTQEVSDIKQKWFDNLKIDYVFNKNGDFRFSESENNWLKNNPNILISGDPNWPPNSMYNGMGNYEGIIADIWSLMEQKSGIKFIRVRSESWAQTIESLRNNEINIIDCISETPERQEFMDFSDILFTSHLVIVGREELDFVNGIYDIGNLSLAVQEGTSDIELVTRDYPEIKLAYYTDVDEAYRDVAAGRIDLFLRHQSDFEYTKKQKMFTNLKIVGPTKYSRDYKIGVRKDQNELLSILNKSLAKITSEERNTIYDKWYGRDRLIIDYALIWKIIISAMIILSIVFYWNRTLAKEIRLRKQIQEELQISMEKAESATRAKSEFLANMSHEIRTPMNAIIGFADLMRKTPLNTVQETYLNTIKSGGATLLNIINDILDLSKIEANKLDINYTYFDICSLIFDLTQFFNEKIKSKNLRFITEHNENMPKIVYLDELRIRQIFFNLLSNAIKFTNNGYIKIFSTFAEKENGNIDLFMSVEDTGIGIKIDDQLKLFGAFEQVNNSNTKEFQGTGLGLAISKKLTELMNGTIRLESEFGKGSKFSMEFYDVRCDRKVLSDKILKDTSIEEIRLNKAKILIADDIESNRLLLIEFCRELGLDTIEAVNGKEAVDMAKLHVPELILLDMRMPVMDGYEAINIIKTDSRLNKIPVIAVTASVMASDKAKIESHKFDGYIRKPVVFDDLVFEMKKFLQYEVIKNELPVFEPEDDRSINVTVMIEKLNSVIKREVEVAKEKHNFGQIQELAKKIKELSDVHNSSKLKMFATKLHNSVIRYDIDNIRILLNNYDDLVISVSKNINSGAENDRKKV